MLRRGRPAFVLMVAVVVLLSAAVVALVPGRGSAAPPPPSIREPPAPPEYMNYVQVNTYRFDPLRLMPAIPAGLRYGSAPAGESYYIVQLRGPVTTSMKAALSATGAALLYYINYNAFIVRADRMTMERIASLSEVRWTGIVEPAYKLSPRLSAEHEARIEASLQGQTGRGDALPGWVTDAGRSLAARPVEAASSSVSVSILTYEPSNVMGAARVLATLGGLSIQYAFSGEGMLRAEVPRASLPSLARYPGVMWIDLETQPILYNDIARWVIQSGDSNSFATPVHEHGIYGTGQTVTLGDSGLDYGHSDFADPNYSSPGPNHRKVTDYYIPPGATGDMQDNGINHGTHTSGTIAGDDGTWHVYDGNPTGSNGSAGPHDGQAFDAKIQMQDISDTDPFVFPPSDMHDMFQPAVDRGSFIHSNSWGGVYGDYITEDQQMDDFIWDNQDFIVTFAAGNPGSSPNLVNPFAVAKNVIGVGATENGLGMQNVASFSGRGPATDGRLKPDVMAPGVDVWSARGCDPNPPCNDYWQLSGTSMATPTAAGAATLVRQYYMDGWYPTGAKTPADGFTPSAALVKATLINSAVEMTGSGAYDNGQNFYPNDNQGWGRILLDNALYFQGDTRATLLDDNRVGIGTGGTASYLLPIADASMPIEITLVWTDYPGVPMTDPNLVNDLNLIVTAPDGTVYRGNVFAGQNPGQSVPNPPSNATDRLNNVESVLVVSNAQVGLWTVDVGGFSVPMGPQPFAIIMTGGVASNYGVVALDHHAYQSSATVNVRVVDTGLNLNPNRIDSTWVWMTSTTETVAENLTLTETGDDTAVFAGFIPLESSATPVSDGVLQVQNGDTITAAYLDEDDGMGGSGWHTTTAVVDDTPPVISAVTVTNLRFNRATITWTTNERSNSTLAYGVGTPPATVISAAGRETSHEIKLAGLAEQTTYFFEVRSADDAGNLAVDNNGTNYYRFTTPAMPPTPAPDTAWPTFHNNVARLGQSPSDMAPPLIQRWVTDPTGQSVYNGPVLKDGLLYATSTDGYIRARDPFTGSVVWSRALGEAQMYTGIPVVDGGVVYTTFVTDGFGVVYALDAMTGDIRWSSGSGTGAIDFFELTAMAHADGLVFGYTYVGDIYALYDTNGSLAWIYPSGTGPMLGVTVAAGLVFASTGSGVLVALDELTGSVVWSTPMDYYVVGPPAYLHGNLYLESYGGTLYNVDAFSGEILWQRSGLGGYYAVLTPATDGKNVYVGIVTANYTFAIIAVDGTTGDVLWTTATPGAVRTSLATANGFVYGVSSDGILWALRASDGLISGTVSLNGQPTGSTPAISDGWIWVDDLSGSLYGFRGEVPVGLDIEPAVQTRDAVPSSIVHYAMTVMNVGTTGPDTFDAVVTPGSLGWSVGLFHADGVTPLADTDSDGAPDTGSLSSGASIGLDVQVSVPAGATLGDLERSLVRFSSSKNVSRLRVASFTTLVPLPGVGVGPRGYVPGTAGATVWWNLTVNNRGGAADTVELSVSSRRGWTVGLYESTGASPLPDTDSDGKPDTGVLPGLGSAAIVLKVQVPGDAAPDSVDVVTVLAASKAVPAATADADLIVELTPPVETEWPQFHHDRERTGVAPVPFELPLTPAWTTTPTGSSIDRSAVVIHDHTAFYADAYGGVGALDLATGTVRWRDTLGRGYYVSGGPAIAYGNVYVALVTQGGGNISSQLTLFALDSATGTVQWKTDAGTSLYTYGAPTTPAVAAGAVFWSSYANGEILATDALTGESLWSYRVPGVPLQGPTYWGGMVYATDTSGELVALDAGSGALEWSSRIGVGSDSAPTVANGIVYASDYYGNVYAFDATSGASRWTYLGSGYSISSSSVAVADGRVYVAAGASYPSSMMYALDADTGALVWSSGQMYMPFTSSPAYNNGTVFEASLYGYLVAWDAATGAIVQEFSLSYGVSSSMAIADGYLVFGDNGGRINAYTFEGTGVLAGAAITPIHAQVPVGGAVILTGAAVDRYGNEIPGAELAWSSSPGLGTLLAIGDGRQASYIAGTAAGTESVVVRTGPFSATARIDVVAGPAHHITVTPAAATVTAGRTLTFSGIVADRFGNARSDGTITWTASAGAGTISSAGVLTASTSVGTGTVTATSGSLSAVITVTVVAGPLASIAASPTSASLAVGASVVLTAIPKDAYGNPTGDTVSWSATAGTVTPITANGSSALYLAPTTAGAQTVTASSGGTSVTVAVDVTSSTVVVPQDWQTPFFIALVAAVVLAAAVGLLLWRSRRRPRTPTGPEPRPPEDGPGSPGGPKA